MVISQVPGSCDTCALGQEPVIPCALGQEAVIPCALGQEPVIHVLWAKALLHCLLCRADKDVSVDTWM